MTLIYFKFLKFSFCIRIILW